MDMGFNGFDAKVVDWNNLVIGRVRATDRDPRTHSVRALVVRLDPIAQRHAESARTQDRVIPMRFVVGLRRGEIVLDRSLDAMNRSEEAVMRGVTCEPAQA